MRTGPNDDLLKYIYDFYEDKKKVLKLTEKEALNQIRISRYELNKIKNNDETVNIHAVLKICYWLNVKFYGGLKVDFGKRMGK